MKTLLTLACLVFVNIGYAQGIPMSEGLVHPSGRVEIKAETQESLQDRAAQDSKLIPVEGLQMYELVKDGVIQAQLSPLLYDKSWSDLSQFQWLQILDGYIDVAKSKEILPTPNNHRRPVQIFEIHLTVPIYFHVRYQLKGSVSGTFSNGTINAVSRITIQRKPGEEHTFQFDLLDWKDSNDSESFIRWIGINDQFDDKFVKAIGHPVLTAYFNSEEGSQELQKIINLIQQETYQERTELLLKKARRLTEHPRPLIVH